MPRLATHRALPLGKDYRERIAVEVGISGDPDITLRTAEHAHPKVVFCPHIFPDSPIFALAP
jgi:hypothetical protein